MHRTFLRGAVGVALWLGSAVVAVAQVQIVNDGPTCVENDDTSSTYAATVTTDYDFDLNLKVYHNDTLRHDTTTFVVNDGPVYHYSEIVDHTGWGLNTGDTLRYRGTATLTEGPYRGSWARDEHSVTVSDPGRCFLDRRREREWAWA